MDAIEIPTEPLLQLSLFIPCFLKERNKDKRNAASATLQGRCVGETADHSQSAPQAWRVLAHLVLYRCGPCHSLGRHGYLKTMYSGISPILKIQSMKTGINIVNIGCSHATSGKVPPQWAQLHASQDSKRFSHPQHCPVGGSFSSKRAPGYTLRYLRKDYHWDTMDEESGIRSCKFGSSSKRTVRRRNQHRKTSNIHQLA